MSIWRDSRHRSEMDADARYAAARDAGRRLDGVLAAAIAEGKGARPMSLMGKMAALTESAQDFNRETGEKLDALATRIPALAEKRDAALAKHHAYYNGLEKGIDDSAAVIDRLSNGPLGGDSESSQGG